MLVLVVGPSGAGKDTLLIGAHRHLVGNPRFRFVRRVITRPADAGGEDHEAVTESEFDTRAFALQWRAHRLRYGIPLDIVADLERGLTVVANVSRGAIAEAAWQFPVRVIEITAPPEVLAARVAARGRETEADILVRLARSAPLPASAPIVTVMNDTTPEDGIARFVEALMLSLRG
jgi:ribose 1,5-bisphosphokinase